MSKSLMQTVFLIHPPLVKPGEPPAGLAKLAGALGRHGIPFTLIDANLEGLLYLLHGQENGSEPKRYDGCDNWTRRARRHLNEHLFRLRSRETYSDTDRYKRAVMDINRVLFKSVAVDTLRLSLSDYEDKCRSPVSSADLIAVAETPAENPFHGYFSERFRGLLDRAQPSWIGFSLNYLSQALCSFAMIGFIRRIFPTVGIVLGGGLVTTWMRKPGWRNPFKGLVDEFIAGPAEMQLLSLLRVDHDGAPDVPDYDALPLPDYLSPHFILPYSASSGCYWRQCAFCPENAEENPYRPLPDDRVISELALWRSSAPVAPARELRNIRPAFMCDSVDINRRQDALMGKTGPVLIHLLDNAVRPSLLKRLTASPPGAPWYGFARVSRDLAEEDFCRGLKHSGCVMLKLGIESGSQSVLDNLQKGIDIQTVTTVLETLHRVGIAAYVYLLFGTPQEKETDALQTLDFVIRNQARIGFLNVALFNLPAHCREADALQTGSFYEGDLSLYRSFRHPAGWDRHRVRLFLNRVFRRHPAVAGILKNDPPLFTSNHAALFALFQSAKSLCRRYID
jgi:hypothetical protein